MSPQRTLPSCGAPSRPASARPQRLNRSLWTRPVPFDDDSLSLRHEHGQFPHGRSSKGQARLLAQPSARLITCAIVRGEIRFGLDRLPPGKRRSDLEVKAGAVFATLPIESVTSASADVYGAIRANLEMQGRILSDNDLWIAATALSLNAVLVSSDQVFRNVPGLTVEDWTT